MPCDDLIRTQLLLDGELEGEDAHAAETHLQSCVECAALAADMRGIRDAIRNHATQHQAPELLRARVRRQIREHGATPRPFWAGALSGAGLTALAASLAALFFFLPPSGETVAGSIADSHVAALMHGPLIEVVSSDHHTVKPWFAGRIDLSPPVQDFRGDGFALAGGRLDRAGAYPAAVVVYRHGKHVIDLYVWHGRGAAESATRHGYHVLSWQSGDLDFSAISDTDVNELSKFVLLVMAERE